MQARALTWRGLAHDKVNLTAGLETREENLNEQVQRMFEGFPPK